MTKYHYTGGGANRTPREVAKLKKKYELFDNRYIGKIFADVVGLKVSGIEKPLNVGLPHVTYIVHFTNNKDLIFRANLGPKEPEIQLLKEKLTADLALERKVPSNRILHVDITRKKYPFDFQIQEKLGGLDAEIVFKGSQQDYGAYAFNLGQVIAKLSDVKLSGFGHFKDSEVVKGNLLGESHSFFDYINLELEDQINTIANAKFITSATARKISRIFRSAKNEMNVKNGSLVHYDLADHNIRYDRKTFRVLAIYDWGASIVGDCLLDLASSPTWKTVFPKQDKLIEGFLSIKSKPDNFEDKLNLYRLRTIIWKVVHNIKFGMATPERMTRLQGVLTPFGLKMTS